MVCFANPPHGVKIDLIRQKHPIWITYKPRDGDYIYSIHIIRVGGMNIFPIPHKEVQTLLREGFYFERQLPSVSGH